MKKVMEKKERSELQMMLGSPVTMCLSVYDIYE